MLILSIDFNLYFGVTLGTFIILRKFASTNFITLYLMVIIIYHFKQYLE